MTPEEKARTIIDKNLEAAGWVVQDYKKINIGAAKGVAIREFPLKTGYADYLLYIDRKAAGVIEAKAEGKTLSGVTSQSGRYLFGLPDSVPAHHRPLPFAYESNGHETFFRDERTPEFRSRRVFSFHRPEHLEELLKDDDTLRERMRKLPPLIPDGLRKCQVEAVTNLEKSFAATRPKALIQMATGSGKTFTAVSFVYRLIKFAKAKRILFLVDRGNLGKQAKKEFDEFTTPDDGRKFSELYNVQHLQSNVLDNVSKVCISTIQRVYSMLRGERDFDPALEENSLFETSPLETTPFEVAYNPSLPIETFDFIITDECHRSIYNLWRQVFEYFDSFIIGLTATPSKQTIGFFNNNLVMEYGHDRAVADGVNVGYEVYRIKTRITEEGSTVDKGFTVGKRNKATREVRWKQLDEDLVYSKNHLDRSVVAPDQIRTVIRTYRDNLFTEIFPGRNVVPKTLIFAKDDSHAEEIVRIAREEFGKGDEFCKKITYRSEEKPEELIRNFRNSYNPRISVTVDMVATGTDIKPLECLLFMRDVRSRTFFEQMKGRGTRTIDSTSLQQVTPDAKYKTHFIIVDAVGVCESDKTDSQPMERKKSVSTKKLLTSVALGNREDNVILTLAGRLSRLGQQLSPEQHEEITKAAKGKSLEELVNGLIEAVNPDKQVEKAKIDNQTEEPTEEQIKKAEEELKETACRPFETPDLRETVLEIKKQTEQTIDVVSLDEVLASGWDEMAKEKAEDTIKTFKQYIEDNRDELAALSIIYDQPYGKKEITYEKIKNLARSIEKPPYNLHVPQVWEAYRKLEEAKVRGAGPKKLLTNIISLIRFAAGMTDELRPFPQIVEERFEGWIKEQEEKGEAFTDEQREWLAMIKDYIAASIRFDTEAFEETPFAENGGWFKANELFKDKLPELIKELNEVLAA